MTALAKSQMVMTGEKVKPTLVVPKRCARKRTTITAMAAPSMAPRDTLGQRTCSPSKADTTLHAAALCQTER